MMENRTAMREAPVRAARAKAVVAEALALRILGGTYPPAKPLPNEAALLGEFKVSRTCLREALQMLAAKGLVRSRPKLGTFVRPSLHWNFLDADILRWRQHLVPPPVFLRELVQVRRMVEPETAALAAGNATPEVLALLQEALAEMARGNGARTEATTEADVVFHRLLLAASGNALLSGLGACIEEALRSSITISSHPDFAVPFALDQHVAVFEAVRDGNPEAARQRMLAVLDITSLSLEKAGYGELLSDEPGSRASLSLTAPPLT
jgi:GntR family transcriptional regulator, galactonate operon transcriptional repressor